MPSDPATGISRRLNDILYNINLAQSFAADIGYDDRRIDLLRLYAITRCLEIISEASRRLPAELKAGTHRSPGTGWPRPDTSTVMNMKTSPLAGSGQRHATPCSTPRRRGTRTDGPV
jgi:hypothetical protein